MKNILKGILAIILILTTVVGLVVIGGLYDRKQTENKYNSGICPKCGTEFHLVNVTISPTIGHEKHYFYACENNHVIECNCEA